RRESARAVNSARGQELRFRQVVHAQRAEPALTRFQLYSETIERALGDRPLTILDPHSGRMHLYLADPDRFTLNLLNTMPASPVNPGAEGLPNNEPSSVTPPEREP